MHVSYDMAWKNIEDVQTGDNILLHIGMDLVVLCVNHKNIQLFLKLLKVVASPLLTV